DGAAGLLADVRRRFFERLTFARHDGDVHTLACQRQRAGLAHPAARAHQQRLAAANAEVHLASSASLLIGSECPSRALGMLPPPLRGRGGEGGGFWIRAQERDPPPGSLRSPTSPSRGEVKLW